MGVVKATNAAMAPMENIAPAARGPPKMRRSIIHATEVFNHTAFTGVLVV